MPKNAKNGSTFFFMIRMKISTYRVVALEEKRDNMFTSRDKVFPNGTLVSVQSVVKNYFYDTRNG